MTPTALDDLHVTVLRSAAGRLVAIVITDPTAPPDTALVAVAGAPLQYQTGCAAAVRDLFTTHRGRDLAQRWGVGKDTIADIRRALGLARTYSGTSRTTRWRKAQRAHKEEEA